VETALRATLWILLGGWIGALALFAVGVAPLAFSVLPAGEGGKIVAPILEGLNVYGIGAGLALAVVGWRQQRGAWAVALPIALAVVCGFSEFQVTTGIAEVRGNAFGVDVTAEAATRFSSLHQLSRALFGLVVVGAIALALLHARFDAANSGGNSRKD
jgi:hypothetical protein